MGFIIWSSRLIWRNTSNAAANYRDVKKCEDESVQTLSILNTLRDAIYFIHYYRFEYTIIKSIIEYFNGFFDITDPNTKFIVNCIELKLSQHNFNNSVEKENPISINQFVLKKLPRLNSRQ